MIHINRGGWVYAKMFGTLLIIGVKRQCTMVTDHLHNSWHVSSRQSPGLIIAQIAVLFLCSYPFASLLPLQILVCLPLPLQETYRNKSEKLKSSRNLQFS